MPISPTAWNASSTSMAGLARQPRLGPAEQSGSGSGVRAGKGRGRGRGRERAGGAGRRVCAGGARPQLYRAAGLSGGVLGPRGLAVRAALGAREEEVGSGWGILVDGETRKQRQLAPEPSWGGGAITGRPGGGPELFVLLPKSGEGVVWGRSGAVREEYWSGFLCSPLCASFVEVTGKQILAKLRDSFANRNRRQGKRKYKRAKVKVWDRRWWMPRCLKDQQHWRGRAEWPVACLKSPHSRTSCAWF